MATRPSHINTEAQADTLERVSALQGQVSAEALRGVKVQRGSMLKCQDAAVMQYVLRANHDASPKLLADDGVLNARTLFVKEAQVNKAKEVLAVLLNPSSRKKVRRQVAYDTSEDDDR